MFGIVCWIFSIEKIRHPKVLHTGGKKLDAHPRSNHGKAGPGNGACHVYGTLWNLLVISVICGRYTASGTAYGSWQK